MKPSLVSYLCGCLPFFLYRVINWTFILKTVCLQPPISRMKTNFNCIVISFYYNILPTAADIYKR